MPVKLGCGQPDVSVTVVERPTGVNSNCSEPFIPNEVEKAADAGLRSIFVGFETLSDANLQQSNKKQNLGRNYSEAIQRLHSLGIMINGSFVFGLDADDKDVFKQTVDWAVSSGLTTSTFHILTPYPGTRLYKNMEVEGRILHRNWNQYDTRQVVYKLSLIHI